MNSRIIEFDSLYSIYASALFNVDLSKDLSKQPYDKENIKAIMIGCTIDADKDGTVTWYDYFLCDVLDMVTNASEAKKAGKEMAE